MDRTVKTLVFWLIIVVSAVLLCQVTKSSGTGRSSPEISYSEFLSQVEAGNIAKVIISGTQIDGKYRDATTFRVVVPSSQQGMLETLHKKNVEIWFRNTAQGGWSGWLLNLAPLILLAVLWMVMIRQMRLKRTQTSGSGIAPTDSTTWHR